MNPAWITALLAVLTFALATGLIVVFGVNLPFVLSEGAFWDVRVRAGPAGSSPLLETFVLVLLTPVLAIAALPLVLAVHAVALGLVYAIALERGVRPGGIPRYAVLIGLAFALTAPLPGVYVYPNLFPSLITLIPGSLGPVVSFFALPPVRYGFIVVAYGLPMVALLLARRDDQIHVGATNVPSPLPAYLLAALMLAGLLLVVAAPHKTKLIGLIWTWTVMVAALLVWSLYYRPAITALRVPSAPSAFERRLTAWGRPSLAFATLTLILLLLTSLPVVDAFVEASALGHHAQHVALLLIGLAMGGLILQQAWAHRRDRTLMGKTARFIYASNVLFNPQGAVGMAFAVVAVALWHVPFFWDLALMDDLVHVLEHLSFIASGSAVAFSLGRMPSGVKYAFLVGGTIAMSLLALTLWFTAVPVYKTYTAAELSALGMIHFLLGAPLMVYAIGAATAALLRGGRGDRQGEIRSR